MKNIADPMSVEQSSFSVSMDEFQTEALWDDFQQHREPSAEDKSPWEGKELWVQWDQQSSGSYLLYPLERPNADLNRFRQPIASAYKATLRAIGSGEPVEKFVIKLPALEGLGSRIELVRRAYQQEYNLRDRFPVGHPRVLPPLMPDHRKDPYWESTPPSLTFTGKHAGANLPEVLPCVIRAFVPGHSLGQWARQQSNCGGPDRVRDFCGLTNSETWFQIGSALLKALSELHRERATHGFIYPENIIIREEAFAGNRQNNPVFEGNIIFTNAAESHRSVYLEKRMLRDSARHFPVRRWYDSLENVYRFAEEEPRWVRFDLDEGSDYYSATDIFSLGVTLAYLATGRADIMSPFDYIEPWDGGWQVVRGAQMRRKYHVMKAKLMDGLLAAAEERLRRDARDPADKQELVRIYDDSLRKAEVILQCARSQNDSRALSANHALTVLQVFRPAESGQAEKLPSLSSAVDDWSDEDLERLIRLARKVGDDPDTVQPFVSRLLDHGALRSPAEREKRPMVTAIQTLVGHRMRSVLERITALDRLADHPAAVNQNQNGFHGQGEPFLRVVGSRSTLIDAFLSAISTLDSGDELIALTTPSIWSDENFGTTSRISSMLQLLRLKGMPMRWVILVSTSDLYKPTTQRVLGFRSADDRKLEELLPGSVKGNEVYSSESPDYSYSGFYYACLDRQRYEQVLRERKTFIGFRKTEQQLGVDDPDKNRLYLQIAPDLSSRSGSLVALTFWMHPRRGKRLRKAFDDHYSLAQPVFTFERNI